VVGLMIIAIIIALILYLVGRDKQTPKTLPPKTPGRVASDGSVCRPQDRSACNSRLIMLRDTMRWQYFSLDLAFCLITIVDEGYQPALNRPIQIFGRATMRITPFVQFVAILLAIPCLSEGAEIYGFVRYEGAFLPNQAIEITCDGVRVPDVKTDEVGVYHVMLPNQGKCLITIGRSFVREISCFREPNRYDLDLLERPSGGKGPKP